MKELGIVILILISLFLAYPDIIASKIAKFVKAYQIEIEE